MTRLSNLHLQLGNFTKAEQIADKLSETVEYLKSKFSKEKLQSKIVDMLCYKSYLYFKMENYKKSEETISQIKAQFNFEDPYGKFLQMAMLYEKATFLRKKREDQSKFYLSVLNSHSFLSREIVKMSDL